MTKEQVDTAIKPLLEDAPGAVRADAAREESPTPRSRNGAGSGAGRGAGGGAGGAAGSAAGGAAGGGSSSELGYDINGDWFA